MRKILTPRVQPEAEAKISAHHPPPEHASEIQQAWMRASATSEPRAANSQPNIETSEITSVDAAPQVQQGEISATQN